MGETPLSARPISAMVHTLRGCSNFRCLAGSNATRRWIVGAILVDSETLLVNGEMLLVNGKTLLQMEDLFV